MKGDGHRVRRSALLLVALALIWSCHGSPTAPAGRPLPAGRYSGDNGCLSVEDAGCNLVVGCGHGRFPRPSLRADGTFDVDGTYRIEAGPVSIDPAPPAHFSGSLTGTRLRLMMVPTAGSLPPMSFSMTPTTAGTCGILCL